MDMSRKQRVIIWLFDVISTNSDKKELFKSNIVLPEELYDVEMNVFKKIVYMWFVNYIPVVEQNRCKIMWLGVRYY